MPPQNFTFSNATGNDFGSTASPGFWDTHGPAITLGIIATLLTVMGIYLSYRQLQVARAKGDPSLPTSSYPESRGTSSTTIRLTGRASATGQDRHEYVNL
ncbi:hypothetical protein QBC40DRAFT_253508 [Triangularia verruculosa]|uniref:Uncharacterized protein n=1 Tax=Triangularia verruculosa TaxID=2587418 RepID=A0AAN7AWH1_9PEZI|nr:hypothetical protein QBC40DRAFT_253508 [Triangularia verruculosa]